MMTSPIWKPLICTLCFVSFVSVLERFDCSTNSTLKKETYDKAFLYFLLTNNNLTFCKYMYDQLHCNYVALGKISFVS